MTLQWYPGHMTKARRELAALMPSQDVVIEVLDARLPGASANPLVTELRRDKPCIKVLAKADLADPAVTAAWLDHLAAAPHTSAFASTARAPQETRARIDQLCRGLAAHRGADKQVRAIVAGVPNAGKSTLINILMNRAVAKVGDRPAVTKIQQRVVTRGGLTITDSPGLLWPRIDDEARAFALAFAGSIPDTALDLVVIATFGAHVLLDRYPALVTARYKLPAPPAGAAELLAEIARRRGGLRPGGVVDLHKAAEVLIQDFRSGALGRITLEVPPAAAGTGTPA